MIEIVAVLTGLYLLIALIDEFVIHIPSYMFGILLFGIIFSFCIYPICAFIGEPMLKKTKEKAKIK